MLDRDDPSTEPMHRLRLACVLERYPRLEGICFHTSPVLEAHFDASGSRVLTRTEDGRAFLWDPYRSMPIASPLPHEGKVLCVALSRTARAPSPPGPTEPPACGLRRPVSRWGRRYGILTSSVMPPSARTDSAWRPLATTARSVSGPSREGNCSSRPCVSSSEVRFVGFSPDGRLWSLSTATTRHAYGTRRPAGHSPRRCRMNIAIMALSDARQSVGPPVSAAAL